MATEAAPTTEAPPVETEATPPIEAPQGEPTPAADPPAEGEPAAPAIPEETLKVAAEKYAAEKLKAANKTMAAARRAEARVEQVTREHESTKATLKLHTDFVSELQTDPGAAIRKVGYASVREFVDRVLASGGEQKEPTADDRVARLEKQIAEREAAAKRLEQQQTEAAAKGRLADALGKQPERFDLVRTDIGQSQLWDAIRAYNELHGVVPDEAVYMMADAIEKDLTERFSKARKFTAPRQGEQKQGAPPLAGKQAGTPPTNAGKTLTNGSTAGAPATRKYSLDPDERRKQVNAEMQRLGELSGAASA